MNEPWQYQLRVYISDQLAELARNDCNNMVFRPLTDILNQHYATMVCQFDSFAEYVVEAERSDTSSFPLYKWTKATIDDPAKRAKHIKAFALRLNDQEVYSKNEADALEAALQPLVGGEIVERMTRHDTNPATNLPVPTEYRS